MLSADDDKLKNEIPSNSEQGKKFRKGIEERKRKKEKERERKRKRKKEREGGNEKDVRRGDRGGSVTRCVKLKVAQNFPKLAV